MKTLNNKADSLFGYLILFIKLKTNQNILMFKPINYDHEKINEKTAQFYILPKNYDTVSIESLNENGLFEMENSIWTNILESAENEQNLGKVRIHNL